MEDPKKARDREWLFCEQLLPKTTYYRHKELELEAHIDDSDVFDDELESIIDNSLPRIYSKNGGEFVELEADPCVTEKPL